MSSSATEPTESVEDFRARAATWVEANLPRRTSSELHVDRWRRMTEAEEDAEVQRNRDLQRLLWDGGFAGIAVPARYGGLGLTAEHNLAFNELLEGRETPWLLQVPTFVPCAAVLLDFAAADLLERHIPAILRGEEIWMQLLSEPSGGSDVAAALTTAQRDGDEWVLNGSKIWTSGAWIADYALCLARTDWDAPKHRGLTVFIVPMRAEGVQLHRIEMIDGSREFCQEFLTDVRVPDAHRIGEVDDGWTVGTRWMHHEHEAMSGASPYVSGERQSTFVPADVADRYVALARARGTLHDPRTRDLIGEARMLRIVGDALSEHLGEAIHRGELDDSHSTLARLMQAEVEVRQVSIGLELAGPEAVAGLPGEFDNLGPAWLVRQQSAIGGGTSEMARNNISERVLGMPREHNPFTRVPFREVPKGPSGS